MKNLNKVVLLVLVSLLMVSCGGNKKSKTLNTNDGKVKSRNTTRVEDRTNTRPVVRDNTTQNTGQQFYDICCNANDLNNAKSLLSQRVILFTYDQATVENKYRKLIAIHARYLKKNSTAKVVLEGHADERGTPEYNLALGERRGKSVANLLRAQGVSANQISVVSYGEEKPVSLCNNDSCWSQNRRVKIVYTAR